MSIRIHRLAALASAVVALTASASLAAPLLPQSGAARIEQISFRDAPASAAALFTLNLSLAAAATGFSSGYVNVADPAGNWLVQNLPVYPSSTYDHPSISTRLPLPTTDGTPLATADFHIDFSPNPTPAFAGGQPSTFTLGTTLDAIGGFGAPDGLLTGYRGNLIPSTVTFNPNGLNSVVYQPRHPNVQAAQNQCAPMAVANSLQWLENEYGINVPHDHVKGLKGDNSLVGKLDTAMNRDVTSRTQGTSVAAEPILRGKLDYVANNNLASSVVTKHQGLLGGANYTSSNVTSTGNGNTVTFDFILSELAAGANVELGFIYPAGGGHFVDITGAGRILGIPFLTYVSDHTQSDLDLDDPNTPADETDTRGTDKVDFSFLVNGVLVNEPGKPVLAFVISQSIPEPAGLLLLASIAPLALRRRT